MDALSGVAGLEKRLVSIATQKKQPIGCTLELLPLCNMNCDMCYVRLSREEMERKGRLRTADEWISIVKEMQENGVLFVMITGGEPLLFPEFKRLYLELLNMGMSVMINSNGTLIDEEWAAFFGKHRPRRFNITLYGKNNEAYRKLCHYENGFDKTVRGIRLLKEHGVDVKMNGSLVKANKDDWKDLLAIAKELEVPINIDTYMNPATRERDMPYNEQARLSPEEAAGAKVMIEMTNQEPEKFRARAEEMLYVAANTPEGKNVPSCVNCRAGRSSFTINWQGEMRPCVMLTEPSARVFEVGFKDSWKEMVDWADHLKLSAKCSQCTLRNVCETCAACALLDGGAYDAVPEYTCRYTKAMLKALKEAAGNSKDIKW